MSQPQFIAAMHVWLTPQMYKQTSKPNFVRHGSHLLAAWSHQNAYEKHILCVITMHFLLLTQPAVGVSHTVNFLGRNVIE